MFSIDVEPDLVGLARTRLAELGYHPTLVAGDGAAGLPGHAPFDRIIATCSVPSTRYIRVLSTCIDAPPKSSVRPGRGFRCLAPSGGAGQQLRSMPLKHHGAMVAMPVAPAQPNKPPDTRSEGFRG